MSNLENLEKELVNIYEEQCYKETKNKEKCLVLDEQSYALLCLCLEVFNKEEDLDKSLYTFKDLFIVRKRTDWEHIACDEARVRGELLKYKKFVHLSDLRMQDVSEFQLVYYALIFLEAHVRNTFGKEKVERNYLKIFAYFACLSPEMFEILFANQIYHFMKTVSVEKDLELKRKHIETEEGLVAEYVRLMQNEECLEMANLISKKYYEFVGCKQETSEKVIKPLADTREKGFLAFSLNNKDSIRGTRFKRVLIMFIFFEDGLEYIKKDIGDGAEVRARICQSIENMLTDMKELTNIFSRLLDEEKAKKEMLDREYENVRELLRSFADFCKDKYIVLIDL